MTDQELTESVSSHKRDDLAKLREDARNAALSGRGPTYRSAPFPPAPVKISRFFQG